MKIFKCLYPDKIILDNCTAFRNLQNISNNIENLETKILPSANNNHFKNSIQDIQKTSKPSIILVFRKYQLIDAPETTV